MKLRSYQTDLAKKTHDILVNLRIVYLAMQMRVGKSLIALEAAKLLKCKHVLFVTKKKAMKSIQSDYDQIGYDFKLQLINYESLHKVEGEPDFIIVDEAHRISAYPKPALRTKRLKEIVKDNYLALLSGTPTPESFSQIYHQLWISENSPFEHPNFYKWAQEFVIKKERMINGYRINDYSKAKEKEIRPFTDPFFITYTQEEAGFDQAEVIEEVIYIKPDPQILLLMNYLVNNRYYQFKNFDGEIVCDSAVKLQQKLHQISSGTVITETGTPRVLDRSKAEYILKNYRGKKIAIFYKFVAEGEALKATLPNWTDSPELFNQQKDLVFISQLQSGSEGVNLSTADILIFYNIDFSAVQYWQARARLQTLNRKKAPVVHWLFTKNGIEDKILTAVKKKKDYTTYYFKKDYLTKGVA